MAELEKVSFAFDGTTKAKTVRLAAGDNTVEMEFTVAKPRLWWPNGMGAQHLYPLAVKVGEAEGRRRIGLRKVEVLTEEPAKAIVAFGDSITALSRWTKPLAKRLAEVWPGEYTLLNSGISGNCLLYEPEGVFGPVFGKKGTVRFEHDVLEIPNLNAVIYGLGVNDVSYLNEKTAGQINLPAYQKAIIDMVDELRRRGVRVCMQTITPRLGVARTMGKYDRNMEALRLSLNDWIRSAGIFDYVFDAEAVVREERRDGFYYAEGLHQGDHLHPNARGGQKLADAFDLGKLTGKEA